MEYYRTTYELEVLSDRPLVGVTLEEIAYEVVEGDCSGTFKEVSREEVTAERMAELLVAQGSDPTFLIPEDEDG